MKQQSNMATKKKVCLIKREKAFHKKFTNMFTNISKADKNVEVKKSQKRKKCLQWHMS